MVVYSWWCTPPIEAQLKFRLFLEVAFPAPRNKIEHGVRARQASPTGAA